MTRAMTLTLTSSLLLIAACDTTDPNRLGPVDAGDPVADPIVEEPADPSDEPSSSNRTLTQEEKELLVDILGGLELDGDLELGGIDELGTFTMTLGSTSAATVTVMDGFAWMSLDTFGGQTFDFTVLVAFDGLDVKTQTVDELVFVLAPIVDAGTVAVAEVPDVGEGFAVYIDEVNGVTYFSQSGDFTIDSVTLDPTTEVDPCAGVGPTSYSCPTVDGTFEGTLDMSTLGFAGVTDIVVPQNPSGTGTPLDITADIDIPLSRTTFTY